MADPFADRLRSELDVTETELARLASRHRLVEELLNMESMESMESATVSSSPAGGKPRARRTARRSEPAAKRSRLPRGLTSGKIREFLGRQREPAHATRILAYLEQHDAVPRSAKPMATVQSSLQRLKETGEIENTGRNHWRLRSAETAQGSEGSDDSAASEVEAGVASPPASGSAAPVVTSTTRFGSTPPTQR